MSNPISFRLDEQINEALEHYVKAKGISKAEFIRTAILEKLEDDYDIMMADQAYAEWEQAGKPIITLEELMEDND